MAVAGSCYLAAFVLSLASLGLSASKGAPKARRSEDPRRLLGIAVTALALVLALASPLDDLGDRFFSAHMVEHELFLYTIPVALLAAQPLPSALVNFRRLPSTWRRSIGHVARHVWILRVVSRLGHPVPALLLSTAALWIWHAPYLYDLALRSEWAHDLEHVSFLATALVYWRPLLGVEHRTAALNSNTKRAFYLIAGGMQGGLLGALIALSGHVVYTGYLARTGASAAVILGDQRLGGAIMWFSGAAFIAAIAPIVMRGASAVPATRPASIDGASATIDRHRR